jgi:hypothetical protein
VADAVTLYVPDSSPLFMMYAPVASVVLEFDPVSPSAVTVTSAMALPVEFVTRPVIVPEGTAMTVS